MAKTPLERAIEACGGSAKLAQKLKITPQAISQWRRIPLARVKQVAAATKIPAHELRPDLAEVFLP